MNKFGRKKVNILQIFGVIVLLVAIVAIFSSTTLAWFMDESTTSNGEPNITLIGTLKLDVTTNFNFENLALAPDTIYETDANGDDIATYIKTADEHNIDGAYVRIKFTTTRREVGSTTDIDNSDLFDLYFATNLTTVTTYSDAVKNKWFFNATDGYYYYIGGVYSKNVMFNKGYKTTNLMQNSNADAVVTIDFVIESIQRQYGASAEVWTTAPEVFKSMATIESEIKN